MKRLTPTKEQELKERQEAPLSTPTDLTAEATRDTTNDSEETPFRPVGR